MIKIGSRYSLPIFTNSAAVIGHNHIDAMKLYEKPMIKGIYKNTYKGLGLDAGSRAVIGRGKHKGYSGKDFNNLPTLDKRSYVLDMK